MSEQRVGFVGYRGMVGSVLMERLQAENDFANIDPLFLSTSQAGQPGPEINGQTHPLGDAYDLVALGGLDAIVTCQGSAYTKKVHPELRRSGWQGYWIDAASELRGEPSSVLISDPVNRQQIDEALDSGIEDLIGPNCSSNILFMGLAGLFKQDLVQKVTMNTYQAVSGAGAAAVIEQLRQNNFLSQAVSGRLDGDSGQKVNVLEVMRDATDQLRSQGLPTDHFGQSIITNALAWIGEETATGQSSEEAKAQAEINKMLGRTQPITIDGNCVRIDSLRSHAIAAAVELKQDIPLPQIEQIITSEHEWIKIIPNNRPQTLDQLTPLAVSESLDIAVGRLRKLSHGPNYLNGFIVADQLLWGAAEPLRRALKIVIERS